MASDYQAIRADSKRRYGTDVSEYGPTLFNELYADRTHFIFEILQNAEDALADRPGWRGSRAVTFTLDEKALHISHFGKPFDEEDVRSICGIAKSTKRITDIGRFGIGFKSVYAFTDRPEIHSGAEDFAIESYVWPVGSSGSKRNPDETVFILPLKHQDGIAHKEITKGFYQLGAHTLLFLRQIEEISWRVEDGPSVLYMRSEPEPMGENVRRITLLGQEEGKPDIDESWLVFSQSVESEESHVGYVEVAFSLRTEGDSQRESIHPVSDSPLVAYFPTVVETNLGFLMQGPYRTTPSRDNVPHEDSWNQNLIEETAVVLIEALRWLRENDFLETGVLSCLPLNSAKFGEGNMFSPLFETVLNAFKTERLLPAHGEGFVSSESAKLARSQELRDLLDSRQLTRLFESENEIEWLSGSITQDRTPELRRYLMQELEVGEVTPETLLPKLSREFLEEQKDDRIRQLYEFLKGQPALLRRLEGVSLVRLEDGSHVAAKANGRIQAFLPSSVKTDFPTVRRAVCNSEASVGFLSDLGLTEPDLVDDVIWNVLPKYRNSEVTIDEQEYPTDIQRILTAFSTDSKTQREKLIGELRKSYFVKALDAGDNSKVFAQPGAIYFSTERLKELFTGIVGVLLLDDSFGCLRGEAMRDLLEACGTSRYLQPVPADSRFSREELKAMRRKAGWERTTGGDEVDDWALRGLGKLFATLPSMELDEQQIRARLLWEALCDVVDRRGTTFFSGTYKWFYREQHSCSFDALFVQQMNSSSWIPDEDGTLRNCGGVVFDSLGWKENPFLLSKIHFKPPVIDQLAKEAGIEPGVLDLLKQLGLTSVADLKSQLGIPEESESSEQASATDVDDAIRSMLGDAAPEPPPATPSSGEEPIGALGKSGAGSGAGTGAGGRPSTGTPGVGPTGDRARSRGGSGKRTPGSSGGRPFISYVGAHVEDEEQDPDGLDQEARMRLEEKAIVRVLSSESQLLRTPTHNPGFDLLEKDATGREIRWIEVKAMTGGLEDRPVGLSRAQFECAREHGSAFWLYVVEHTDSDVKARIVRIQDPAGQAKNFTFDRGWASVAEITPIQEDGEE